MAENTVIGKCRFCGGDIKENQYGWGCSNYKGGCKAFIFKEDNFFKKMIGRKPTADEAKALLKGVQIDLQNVVINGKKGLLELSWGEKGGKYPFGYDYFFTPEN